MPNVDAPVASSCFFALKPLAVSPQVRCNLPQIIPVSRAEIALVKALLGDAINEILHSAPVQGEPQGLCMPSLALPPVPLKTPNKIGARHGNLRIKNKTARL